jgi:hypothetical protein
VVSLERTAHRHQNIRQMLFIRFLFVGVLCLLFFSGFASAAELIVKQSEAVSWMPGLHCTERTITEKDLFLMPTWSGPAQFVSMSWKKVTTYNITVDDYDCSMCKSDDDYCVCKVVGKHEEIRTDVSYVPILLNAKTTALGTVTDSYKTNIKEASITTYSSKIPAAGTIRMCWKVTPRDIGKGGHIIYVASDGLTKQDACLSTLYNITAGSIYFTAPTPANGTVANSSNLTANLTITTDNLDTFKFNWNGTNVSVYDSSLLLNFNFEDINISNLSSDTQIQQIVGLRNISSTSTIGSNDTQLNASMIYNGQANGYYNGWFLELNNSKIVRVNQSTKAGSSGTYSWLFIFNESYSGYSNGSSWRLYVNDTVFSAGKYGKGMRFFGDRSYQKSITLIPGSLNAVTMSAWINCPVWGAVTTYGVFTNGLRASLRIDLNGRVIISRYKTGVGGTDCTGVNILPINTWVNILGIIDNSSKQTTIYINGVFEKNCSITDDLTTFTGTSIQIGSSDSTAYNNYFNGTVDVIKFWSRSLSAAEIAIMYQSEFQKYNASEYRFYVNVSNLTQGTYTYYGWANDTGGNSQYAWGQLGTSESGIQYNDTSPRYYTYSTTTTTTTSTTSTTTTSTSTTSTSTTEATTTTSSGSSTTTTLGCCAVNIMSSAGEPVQYATATIRNITSGVLYGTNSSDSSGNVYWNMSCEDLNWTIVYPTSSYSAVLGNMSVQSEVHINDYVTARVQILNTLGSMLEGQDASVSVYDANGSLIHDFRTLCQSKPEIVCQGSVCNYASVSDCEFSDSQGWYYFKGKVLEADGFAYASNYTLRIVANGQMAESNFTTVLDKQPDTSKLEAFLNQYGGMIVLGILGTGALLVFAVIAVSFLSWAWHRGRKKH